jgi:hypothetical protein
VQDRHPDLLKQRMDAPFDVRQASEVTHV